MKNITTKYSKRISIIFLLMVTLIPSFLFQSCKDDSDEGGTPSVHYIRLTDPDKSDSLIARAFMGTVIAIVGENLQDVNKVWFNDQSAFLNTSFITSTCIIVTVPNEIPQTVTNKMVLVTYSGEKVSYPFGVDVPPPMVTSMLCEQLDDGDTAFIQGNFFLDDPNIPLEVIFPGNLQGDVLSISLKEISVVVPEGSGAGPITVKSLYGASRSGFYFRDDRNIFLDFDELTAAGGWRSGVIGNSSPDPVSGNYVRFNGSMGGKASATWNEDAFSFNYWPQAAGKPDIALYDGDLSAAALKFECIVLEDWKASALQMIFTSYDITGTNSYIGDASVPRGLWMPWKASGSYKTNGWITVSIPLTDFKYTPTGDECANSLSSDMLRGLTFFVWHGGVDGEDCTVHMCIDNLRIVPIN